MSTKITIKIDSRETSYGLAQLFDPTEMETQIKYLQRGDYIINDSITIERKTAEDFIRSIMDNRLFSQCANLQKYENNPIFLIEGNPFTTKYAMEPKAIRGAIVAISVSWRIPILFSQNKKHSADLFLMIGKQHLENQMTVKQRKGYRPKKIRNQRLYILQGLPGIGPKLALQLLEHFGTVEKTMCASQKELRKVPGIGKIMAKKIRTVIAMDL